LTAINSINWAPYFAQTTYYFHAYFTLLKNPSFKASNKVHFVVPTGNFGNILAGYFVKRMGLPVAKLVLATNENDILDRFWKTGHYEKKAVHGMEAQGGLAADGAKAHEVGVKETLSPAMDILVSSSSIFCGIWPMSLPPLQVWTMNRRRSKLVKRLKAG
jgi:threonine synthase